MKAPSIAKLKKQIREKYFNRFIRLRDSCNGYSTCVTCGHIMRWEESNAGHFQHGLDFVEDNQHAQCVKCNLYKSGELDKYTIFMIDKYGRERVDELIRMKHAGQKYSRQELEDIRKKYKQKVEELEATKVGLSKWKD